MIEGFRPPCVHFRTRVRDESIEGPNPYRWETVTSDSIFKNRRVVLFSLPGAFTPTCSTYQLPGFEENYDNIRNADIDEVYCISVNDAFVMNAWGKQQGLQNVKLIPGWIEDNLEKFLNEKKPKISFVNIDVLILNLYCLAALKINSCQYIWWYIDNVSLSFKAYCDLNLFNLPKNLSFNLPKSWCLGTVRKFGFLML